METFERVLPGLGAAGRPSASGYTSVPRRRRPAPVALAPRRRAWRRCSASLPGGAPLRRVVPRTAQHGRRRVRAAQGACTREHHATHGDGAALHSDGCGVRRTGSVSRALVHGGRGLWARTIAEGGSNRTPGVCRDSPPAHLQGTQPLPSALAREGRAAHEFRRSYSAWRPGEAAACAAFRAAARVSNRASSSSIVSRSVPTKHTVRTAHEPS